MRRLPSFFALRAFEAAARLGSFAAAAAELSLTPSAISHQVRALEGWFDRPLFVRSVRQLTLTADGSRLLRSLGAAFDLIEEGCAALRPAAQRRELAVHCAPSFATKWLGPRLTDFMRAHPAITIRMSSGAEPIDLHKHGEIDLAITYGPPARQSGVTVESLGVEATVPLVAPALLPASSALTPRDVTRLKLIESKLNPMQWPDWCRLNGVRLPDTPRPSFDRGSLAVAAAVDGLGVALETTRFAEAELASGALLQIDGPAFQRIVRDTHFLCYREAGVDNAQLQAFRQWLQAQIASAARAGIRRAECRSPGLGEPGR